MTIGVTNFPVTLDDLTSLIRAVNRTSSELSSSITALDDEITVDDASMAPVDGLFWIDAEAITFESKTGNTLEGCTRGANGTVAAPHAAGADVYFDIWAAAHHNVLAAAMVATQTKLGAGSSVAAAGQFLKGTGAATSGWGALTAGEVNAALGYTASALTDRAEVLLLSQSFSNVAAVTADSLFSDTYQNYRVILAITQFHAGNTNQGIRFRLRSGGVSYSTANYVHLWTGYTSSAAADDVYSFGNDSARFGSAIVASGATAISDFIFNDLRAAGRSARWLGQTLIHSGNPGNLMNGGGWLNDSAYTADGLTIFSNSGNLSGGLWVYGLKAS